MSFTPFQNLIPRTARKYGIYGAMKAIATCKAANRAIAEIFQHREHNAVQAKSISNGVLKILVPSSAWAQEITLHRMKLMDKVNSEIGQKAVKSIKTTTKSA